MRKWLEAYAEELGIALGLCFVAVGLWYLLWPAALIVTGLVILWVTLPTRAPFIERPKAEERKR